MKKALLSLVIASGALSLSNTAKAASYILQYSDTYGNATIVELTTGISGYTDGSELVTSGTMTLTSSMNSNAYVGTYSLVAGGPDDTTYYMAPGEGGVYYDNLFYPNQNAGAGVHGSGITDPSYLNYSGLLFNQSGSPYSISLFGSGVKAKDYGLWVNDYNTGAGIYKADSTGTLVPEASSFAILGVAMIGGVFFRRRAIAAA